MSRLTIAEQIVEVLAGKPARAAVNMPSVSADMLARLQPFLTLAEKIGSLQAQLTSSPISEVEVVYAGRLRPADRASDPRCF